LILASAQNTKRQPLIDVNADHRHWHYYHQGGHDHYGMTLMFMSVASSVDQTARSSDEGDGAGK